MRLEFGPADLRIADIGDRADTVVHPVEHEDVGVAEVAGDQEGGDLPAPVRKLLVAAGPAFEDKDHAARLLALAHEIAARCDLADGPGRPCSISALSSCESSANASKLTCNTPVRPPSINSSELRRRRGKHISMLGSGLNYARPRRREISEGTVSGDRGLPATRPRSASGSTSCRAPFRKSPRS